jgi:peptidoglycan/LPS O-acetylase OafA/YrhL
MVDRKYRPDIDGLRAIAVLSVLAFHFDKTVLPGGFVGVDIFFAISGYLITGIIFREHQANRFSFKEFFLRRAKRILPASLVMIAATLLFASTFLMPADAAQLSWSAIASVFSAANVFFWMFLDDGYFANSSDTVPLLHMWSLGVEEQFYLIWPAVLVLLLKHLRIRHLLVCTTLLIIGLVFASIEFTAEDPSFAYYMLPSRAGELLVGALAFLVTANARYKPSREISTILSVTGSALIVYSLVFYTKESLFPGWIAMVPTIGTAFLLVGGSNRQNLVCKTLSTSPLRWVGTISFSLYLWHWPVLALYRYAYGEPTPFMGIALLAVIGTLSLLSYYLVELPFRSTNHSFRRTMMAPAGLSFLIFLIATVSHQGLGAIIDRSSEYQTTLMSLEAQTKPAFSYPYVCQISKFSEDLLTEQRCNIGKNEAPSILIFGDSHAAHYVGYFKAISQHINLSFRNIAHSACPPFFGDLTSLKLKNEESCSRFNQSIKAELRNYDTIIVGGSWDSYFSRSPESEKLLIESIDFLSRNVGRVIIAERIPSIPSFDRDCMKKSLSIPFLDCESRGHAHAVESSANRLIRSIAGKYDNVFIFSLRDRICSDGICSAYSQGAPIYYDSNHLSLRGSEHLGKVDIVRNSINPMLIQLASTN